MSELSKSTAKLSELLKKDSLFMASELIDGDGLLALTEDETRRKIGQLGSRMLRLARRSSRSFHPYFR